MTWTSIFGTTHISLTKLEAGTIAKIIKKNKVFDTINAFFMIKQYFIHCSARQMFVFSLVVLLICYLPAFLALYPGTLGYDGPIQVAMCYGSIPISTHHPLFHTWLLGGIIWIGKFIFGSYNAGLILYSLMQAITVLLAVSATFWVLRRDGLPMWILLLLLLYVAFSPYLQVLAFATTKDVLFGAFFLYFLLLFKLALEPQPPFGRWIYVLLFCAALLSCLTRNQGIYIMLGMLMLSLIGRMKAQISLALTGAILGMALFSLTTTHLLHIHEGDAREMFSVPMQQVARVFQHGGELTDEQKTAVYQIIPPEGIASYDEKVADAVKGYFNTAELKRDLPRYLRTYWQIGMQNPRIYFDAFFCLVAPYFGYARFVVKFLTYSWTFPEAVAQWHFHLDSHFPKYHRLLTCLIDPGQPHPRPFLQKVQPLLTPFQPRIAILLLFVASLLCVWRRSGMALVCAGGGLYLITMFLGPVALLRYAYPLLLQVPLYAGLIVGQIQKWRALHGQK